MVFFALCALLLSSFILSCALGGRVNYALEDKPALPKLRLELRSRKFSSHENASGTEEGGDGRIRLNAYLQAALKRSQLRKDSLNKMIELQHLEDGVSGFASRISSSFGSKLYANSGEYLVEIQLGTPAQPVKLVLDTGSDLVWTGSEQSGFAPSHSSSYKATACSNSLCSMLPSPQCHYDGSCGYTYGYGDGSETAGVLSQESLLLPLQDGQTLSLENINFGYSTSIEGQFAGASGVLGLSSGYFSFSSQIGNHFGNIFSYCLLPWNDPEASPLSFGDSASFGAFFYSPMISGPLGFYYIGLDYISVQGQVLDIPAGTFGIQSSGGVFLDSGTTLTFLVSPAYNPLKAAMQARIPYPAVQVPGLDVCYDMSGVSNPSFPSLTFSFSGGPRLDLPLGNYFTSVSDYDPIVCLAFTESSRLNILGNILQQSFQIVHDRQNARFGFNGPVDCRYVS